MNQEKVLQVIKMPHTSEKATIMADRFKQITFKVIKDSNKQEIKAAVEKLFSVKVKSVSVMNVKGKTKRFRQREGKRKDWKKAYVTLESGYDIDYTITE